MEISDKGESTSTKLEGENHRTRVEDTSVELRRVTCEAADINAKA